MKEFMEAVVVGGLALVIGAFLGLLLDGVLAEYVPDESNTTEYEEYQDSILSLVIDFFLPLWFIGLLIGVVALIMSVADVM